MDGILNIIKPTGMTSHDVVYKVRKKLGIKKVGHTGTLDPNASGVLPICVGQGTKISQFLLEKEKAYRTTCRLGVVTDTQDLDGKVLEEQPVRVRRKEVQEALSRFTPAYDQLPPMYSALKVGGKKLYEYAREGIEVPREKRRVELKKLELLDFGEKEFSLDVVCSKGTYIRTLCHDIGQALGTGGAMAALERRVSGPFTLEQGMELEAFLGMEKEAIADRLFPVDYPLSHYPKFFVPKDQEKLALNGNKIRLDPKNLPSTGEKAEKPYYRIYLEERFIGIGAVIEEQGRLKMKFVKVIL